MMNTEPTQVLNALIKLAAIGAAVVTQQAQIELAEKQAAFPATLVSGLSTSAYTLQNMKNDTDFTNKLTELEQKTNLTNEDIIVLNALLDKHRHSNVGLAAAAVGAGIMGLVGAGRAIRTAPADLIGSPLYKHMLEGALGGAIAGAIPSGIGGWAGKRVAAYGNPYARRARKIIQNYENAKYRSIG